MRRGQNRGASVSRAKKKKKEEGECDGGGTLDFHHGSWTVTHVLGGWLVINSP